MTNDVLGVSIDENTTRQKTTIVPAGGTQVLSSALNPGAAFPTIEAALLYFDANQPKAFARKRRRT